MRPAKLHTMTAPRRDPPALHDRALQDLSFIRRTMEGAASFTDVPGWGLVATGGIGLAAAGLAHGEPTAAGWLRIWLAAAVLAGVVGSGAMLAKMRRRMARDGSAVLSVPARKFLLSFWPAIAAGAVLTLALMDPAIQGGDGDVARRILPGLWLLLYGVGITTAGAFSVRPVPLMGIGFLLLGVTALLLPTVDGDLALALGFGVLQVVFGILIARRHGG